MGRKKILAGLSVLWLAAGCTSKHRLIVGSKNFTEQVILGEIIAQQLENRLHQSVVRKLDLGGTMLAHQALLAGDIDLYPEYTGTAFTNILKRSGVNDPAVVLDRVRSEYTSGFHLSVLDPLGFDSSFAMTVRGDDTRARHLEKLSDAASDSNGFSLGAGYEFLTRPDGYPALSATYAIKWTAAPKSMDLGLLYQALLGKQVSMVAANTTDGALAKLDVRVLQDDKHAFPPYQACIIARSELLAANPQARTALTELSGKFSDDTMRKLNYAVDVEHRRVRDVAKDFLGKVGL